MAQCNTLNLALSINLKFTISQFNKLKSEIKSGT